MTRRIRLVDDEVTLRSKTRCELALTDRRLHQLSGSELVTRLRAHADDPALLDGLRALLDGKH